MQINVEQGYVTVIERFGKFGRIAKPGKHNLIPGIEKAGATFRVGVQTLSDTVDTNDDHAIKTIDGIKVGYRYEICLDIQNPEKFYKTDFMYPNCTGLKADAEWMIEDKMSSFRYVDIIDEFSSESDEDGKIALNDDELRYIQKAADKADIKILGVKFELFFGKDYEYWKVFCQSANENGRFRTLFGKIIKQFDSNNAMDLPCKDGRYFMRLSRETAKNLISVEVRIRKRDTNYNVLLKRQNYIENELRWNFDWVETNGEFAIAKISIKLPPASHTDKSKWEGQHKSLMSLAMDIKNLFTKILDEYGTPDVINVGNSKIEVIACVCPNCGGSIDTSTRVCPFCGASQMLATK